MYSYIQLGLIEPTAGCSSWLVASNPYSGHLPVGQCLGPGSLLLVGPSFHFPETNMCAPVTQWLEQVHNKADKRALGVFTFNCLQTGHWVKVDYNIVMNWTHVSVIVQRQNDGSSLSYKDGAVVWQSFGQLVAGCLIILEMAVDDRRCLRPLSAEAMSASTLRQMTGAGGWVMPPLPFGWEAYRYLMVWSIHAGHDVLDRRYKHEISDSNAWVVLT